MKPPALRRSCDAAQRLADGVGSRDLTKAVQQFSHPNLRHVWTLSHLLFLRSGPPAAIPGISQHASPPLCLTLHCIYREGSRIQSLFVVDAYDFYNVESALSTVAQSFLSPSPQHCPLLFLSSLGISLSLSKYPTPL